MSIIRYEQIKRIYDCLRDEISRDIFEKRLMYSLSGEKKYIDDMILTEMRRYGSQDIMMKLLAWIDEQDRPLVIFGAGFVGWKIANILRVSGKKILCFLDNNKEIWGKKRYGLEVCQPSCLAEIQDSCVIIGMDSCISEVKNQILKLGVEASHIFVSNNGWNLGTEIQYFDSDIMKAKSHESFVDGGALDGNDSREFIKWCKGDYDAIYLFEPDVENREKISLLKNTDERIHIYEEGLWSGSDKLLFSMGEQWNSAISEHGNTIIPVTSIDEKLCGAPVSIIKMDIEGSEWQALKGAERTIKKYHPRLAICVS